MHGASPSETRRHDLQPLDNLIPSAYAYISNDAEVDTAVIFVHGFKGNPTTTWEKFQSMIDSHGARFPEWNHADVFFFTYLDTIDSIDDSADGLRGFVDTVFPSTSKPLATLLGFQREYRKLVLVGHSEGAVVIRAAVAYAGTSWVTGPVTPKTRRSRSDEVYERGGSQHF